MPNEYNPPLNQILYGPPGTGKTFKTAQMAVEIIEGQKTAGSRDEIMQKYKKYSDSGQIKFITFHQSYSYEEFVEGIRPVLVNENGKEQTTDSEEQSDCKDVKYRIHQGIFKTMAIIAKENLDKKYKIKAYDPDPKVIDIARKKEYLFTGDNSECYLLSRDNDPYRHLFKKNATIKESKDKYGNEIFNCKINDNLSDGVLEFKEGNIADIDKEKLEQKPGVIIFKNAWYHLHEIEKRNSLSTEYDIENLKKTLNKIADVLPENGILVTGNLARDHILKGYPNKDMVVTNSPFHKALLECGFEPIPKYFTNSTDWDYYKLKIPTIWKKSKNKNVKLNDTLINNRVTFWFKIKDMIKSVKRNNQ